MSQLNLLDLNIGFNFILICDCILASDICPANDDWICCFPLPIFVYRFNIRLSILVLVQFLSDLFLLVSGDIWAIDWNLGDLPIIILKVKFLVVNNHFPH